MRLQAKDEKKERKALRKIESKMMGQKARAFIQRLVATKESQEFKERPTK